MNLEEVKVCPFCDSSKLDISVSSGNNCYYKQVYCKNCHAYGPRLRYPVEEKQAYNVRYSFEHDQASDEQAIKLWNNRFEGIKA